jgi:hypothetical protein
MYYSFSTTQWIWWYAIESKWKINFTVGAVGGAYFTSPTTLITGTYVPGGTATGNPVIAATP